MNGSALIIACSLLLCFSPAFAGAGSTTDFIENKGQWPAIARYKAELPDGALFLTDQGFVYHYASAADKAVIHALKHGHKSTEGKMVRHHAYKVNFTGATPGGIYEQEDRRSYYHNYFTGRDRSAWAGKVGIFGKVIRKNVYPGIDLAVYGKGNSLKYDFIVNPGADPGRIVLAFEGVQPALTAEGHLKLVTSVNEVTEQAPYAYQPDGRRETAVACRYRLVKGKLTFELPEGYDRRYPLIIDPELIFATYSGATGISHLAYTTTYDAAGNLYAGTDADMTGWPVTTGAFQMSGSAGNNVGISKYNATGTTLLYATYYGGSGNDLPHAMIVNDREELIVAGSTSSSDLPVTAGCYDSTLGGNRDFFVVHFDSTGSTLAGATYIGGSAADILTINALTAVSVSLASPCDLVLDSAGNIWVAGNTASGDFPVTAHALQPAPGGGSDGAVFQLNPECSQLLYSSRLGGSGSDAAFGIIRNHEGNIVVCGATTSADFPVTAGVLHTAPPGGDCDGFVSVISSLTGDLLYSTYIGTPQRDQALRVQVDEADHIYVLGRTLGNYPVSTGVYVLPNRDIFVNKLSSRLDNSIASTRTGNPQSGISRFIPTGFLVDNCGNTYVGGLNAYHSLPVTAGAFAPDRREFWFCVLGPDFTGLLFASYFGAPHPASDHCHEGIHRLDPQGVLYHSICTSDRTFPVTPGVHAPVKLNTGLDAVSFRFDFEIAGVRAGFSLAPDLKDTGCVPYTVTFVNHSVMADIYAWDFGDGSPISTQKEPVHTYTHAGVYTVSLYVHKDSVCRTDDTARRTIWIFDPELPDITVRDTIFCNSPPGAVTIRAVPGKPGTNYTYLWQPSAGITGPANQSSVHVDPVLSSAYTVTVWDTIPGFCGFSLTDTVHIIIRESLRQDLGSDTVICKGTSFQLTLHGSVPAGAEAWWSTGSTTQSIQVEEPGVYWVTVNNPPCLGTDTVWIGSLFCDCDVRIPTAFSPNGDGLNDVFIPVIYPNCLVGDFMLRIYNRWGTCVFAGNDPSAGWDGVYRGMPAEVGTYMYDLHFKGGMETYYRKGDLTLLR